MKPQDLPRQELRISIFTRRVGFVCVLAFCALASKSYAYAAKKSAPTSVGTPSSKLASKTSASKTTVKSTVKPSGAAPAASTTVVRVQSVTTQGANNYNLKTEVEKRIVEVQKQAAPDLTVGAAVCPDSLGVKTDKIPIGTYDCSITIAGVKAPYTVVVKEGGFQNSGVFEVAPAKAIVSVQKIVNFIKTSLDPIEADKAVISCGKAKVIVGDPGTPIPCTITSNGNVQTLIFAIRNVNGLVTLQERSTTTIAGATSVVPGAVDASTTVATKKK
jgi:hypothetical protein